MVRAITLLLLYASWHVAVRPPLMHYFDMLKTFLKESNKEK
jgi:hypothetical protein